MVHSENLRCCQTSYIAGPRNPDQGADSPIFDACEIVHFIAATIIGQIICSGNSQLDSLLHDRISSDPNLTQA